METNNVLVTGGAGYIGSHVCKLLRKEGFTPVTFDNLSTGWEDSVLFGPFFRGDLLNLDNIHTAFKKYKPIAIMHFAALSQVGESTVNPGIYWRNNVTGSLNLIEACIKFNCYKFIFSSTCATYGEQENAIFDECLGQLPSNPYGQSKRAVEEILKGFDNSFGLKSVIFRYFNVAGADKSGEIGEFHVPETHLIPRMFDVVDGKKEVFEIFGTDYSTADGTCIRDFVHVNDVAEAHVLGLKYLMNFSQSKVYNLGSGTGHSIKEVLQAGRKITKNTIPVVEGPRRPGDAARLVSVSDLAKEELKWVAKRSDISQIIYDAWKCSKLKYFVK